MAALLGLSTFLKRREGAVFFISRGNPVVLPSFRFSQRKASVLSFRTVMSPVSNKSLAKGIGKDLAATRKENVPDVDLEKLMERITHLLELIEKEKQSTPSKWPWPDNQGLTKLRETLEKPLKKFLSTGPKIASSLRHIISGPVKELLKEIGHASLVTAGLLVVVYSLERYAELSQNKKECVMLLKEMCYLASLVKLFKESPKGTQNVIENATALIVEGAILCCTQMKSSAWKRFFNSSKTKVDLTKVTQNIDRMYRKINIQIGLRVLTATEKLPLRKRIPKHAVGLGESITEVMKLLECKSEQNAVTVILHGSRGMGKTTLAEAVFSEEVVGYKYSKIRLFQDKDSTPDLIEFQKAILRDLMGPEETLSDIRTHEDGQDALEDMLQKVKAFIYIDNVLKSSELQRLLPKGVENAKKVRFLLTAPDIEGLEYACPTLPKIYPMKGIHHEAARKILEKEIKGGIDGSQFNEIIKICGGVPLILTLVATFIGRANEKEKAYERLKQMRSRFAYNAIPDDCKDPFLYISSFFKKRDRDWDTVEDTLGEESHHRGVKFLQDDIASFRQKSTYSPIMDARVGLACSIETPYTQSPTMNTNRHQMILRSSPTLRNSKRNLLEAFDSGRENGDQ